MPKLATHHMRMLPMSMKHWRSSGRASFVASLHMSFTPALNSSVITLVVSGPMTDTLREREGLPPPSFWARWQNLGWRIKEMTINSMCTRSGSQDSSGSIKLAKICTSAASILRQWIKYIYIYLFFTFLCSKWQHKTKSRKQQQRNHTGAQSDVRSFAMHNSLHRHRPEG